jgi:multiple sugar transport system substrate-binding protein
VTSGEVPDVMDDADLYFTPLTAWQDKLLDLTDIIDTQKPQFSEIVLLGRHLYNGVTKQRAYLLRRADEDGIDDLPCLAIAGRDVGYKVSDIPNTWDAYIDFFLPMKARLRSQGRRNICSMSLECSTNGVDPVATFNSYT